MDNTTDTAICLTCGIVGKYSNLANGYVGSLADILQSGMVNIFLVSLPIWFTFSVIRLLLKKNDWANIGYDALIILIAFTLLSINGNQIITGVYSLSLELMGSTASLTFLGDSNISSFPDNTYMNPKIIDLVYTVEQAIVKVFDTALLMITTPASLGLGVGADIEIPNATGIMFGILLIIPYFIILAVFFSKVVIAIFRVMMLALFSPLVVYCFAFGWGRGMGAKAIKTGFASILILLASTSAMSMLVYGAAQVKAGAITGNNLTEVWADYLLLIALGYMGTAFMVEANGLANSLADSVLSNAGAAVITAGAGATAMALGRGAKGLGLNPISNTNNSLSNFANSEVGKAAGWLAGGGAVGAAKGVASKLSKLKEQI